MNIKKINKCASTLRPTALFLFCHAEIFTVASLSLGAFAALRFTQVSRAPGSLPGLTVSSGLYLILCLFQTSVFQSSPLGSYPWVVHIKKKIHCTTKFTLQWKMKKKKKKNVIHKKKRRNKTEGWGDRGREREMGVNDSYQPHFSRKVTSQMDGSPVLFC